MEKEIREKLRDIAATMPGVQRLRYGGREWKFSVNFTFFREMQRATGIDLVSGQVAQQDERDAYLESLLSVFMSIREGGEEGWFSTPEELLQDVDSRGLRGFMELQQAASMLSVAVMKEVEQIRDDFVREMGAEVEKKSTREEGL